MKRKSFPVFFVVFGLFWGLAEAIFVLKTLPYKALGNEALSLMIFSAVTYGILVGILGVLLGLIPFLRTKSAKPGYLLVLLGVILFVAVLIYPSNRLPEIDPALRDVGSPNLIFISLDTTSGEHLSLYGYERNTSPNLDSLARRGVVFEQAISTSNWTLAGHASMFTGLYPSEHGATYRTQYLREQNTTLAEILAKRGYLNAGFIGGPYVGSAFGMNQGFQYYDEQLGALKLNLLAVRVVHEIWETFSDEERVSDVKHFFSRLEGFPILGKRPADMINARILNFFDRVEDASPYFLFVNYFDPHQPYTVDFPYDTLFAADFCPSPSDSLKQLNRKYTQDRHRYFGGEWGSAEDDFLPLVPLYQRLGRDVYDALIYYMDERMGELFRELQERDLLENTLIVITADHGEAIGEHKLWGHDGLYDEIMRVPLVLLGAGVPEGIRIDEQVSTKDLHPTLLNLLGIAGEADPEKDLARYWNGGERDDGDTLTFAQFFRSEHLIDYHGDWFDCDAFMIRSKNWKMLSHTNGVLRKFDLLADPDEVVNLADSLEATVMDTLLDRFVVESMEAVMKLKPRQPNAVERDKLRAVGYVQ